MNERSSQAPSPADLDDDSPVVIPRARHKEDSEMDITPMIDITFLLLIFFLVASKMDEAAAVTLPKARHGQTVAEKSSVVILITQGSGEDAVVSRGDGTAVSTDLEQQEAEIGEYVEAGMGGSAPFDEPKQNILIKAARGVKHRDVARVSEAVGKATELPVLNIAVLEEG